MMNGYFEKIIVEIKRAFKTEDSKFILFTGIKVAGISFLISLFIHFLGYEVMRLNYSFFKAKGFPVFSGQTPFYDYLIGELLDNLTVFFIFHIFLFFIGSYVGWLILRPFRSLGDYCEKVIDNPNVIYRVDEFSHYQLLTRFSEFFFEFLRDARKKGDIQTRDIPPQFLKIHRPSPDWVFMLHFGILLVIIGICTAVFTIENVSNISSNMTELATKTLSDPKETSRFLGDQIFIIDDIIILSITLIIIGYIGLGFHLYNKVSGAAFGIFSTMRSFTKGNHFSRVHLVGYAYIRDYTRKINKYLDYIQKNLSKDKSKN